MTFQEQAEAAGRALLSEAPPEPRPRKIPVRFRGRVYGRFGKGGKTIKATVEIDRAGTFHVRPFRSPARKARSLPLEVVAAWAFQKLAAVEGSKLRAARRRRAS